MLPLSNLTRITRYSNRYHQDLSPDLKRAAEIPLLVSLGQAVSCFNYRDWPVRYLCWWAASYSLQQQQQQQQHRDLCRVSSGNRSVTCSDDQPHPNSVRRLRWFHLMGQLCNGMATFPSKVRSWRYNTMIQHHLVECPTFFYQYERKK